MLSAWFFKQLTVIICYMLDCTTARDNKFVKMIVLVEPGCVVMCLITASLKWITTESLLV